MLLDGISFKNTGYFSSLICDYLDENPQLKPFYNRFPNLENFKEQIEEKALSFSLESRETLVKALKRQYKKVETSELTLSHIDALQNENTFTITTGHQLNLFTGPLYFLYKIVSTINLSRDLKEAYPDYNFVPIYWMATEDHDFEEINYFNFNGKKVHWNRTASGPVGELSTEGLEEVFNLFALELGTSKNAEYLKKLFKKSYLEHDNLANATRYLANELFKDYGLVIIDANDKTLKQQFMPYVKEELFSNTSFTKVTETNEQLNAVNSDYTIQVNPREINVFYIKEGLRERIVFENETFSVLNTDIVWTTAEIEQELQEFPERFSPNVITRPLYQEVILPNLCYIGGGGELAYWFQLKQFFNKVNVTFPVLLLRNSVLIETQSQYKKLQNLNISTSDIFLKQSILINKKVREISNIDIDFSAQKETLQKQFEDLYTLAEQTDKSFIGAVKAQEVKQLKGLEHLEKRLLKAQKKKLADQVSRMTDLQNELFPNQSLQERNTNFSQFYMEYGTKLIPTLIKYLNPLNKEFSLLKL
ncbi:bacillithiol biosynthesis cysteine-adding enzyme BshC [Aestuariibaculum suncheonense]|uniref:Putative cysteine ligase BshC n=1 Tax=Aestuariibaculum suncheonense TaxID=1028745 RepID=A0A8J6UHM5_9FLAO|nr:bacillithiol biosynthesis cysteine-adding enzyme BshC [Aestuariibaculum suncheonense]MBD0835904.1 bacillithiol biosynthesis cysteine-adding enzyme BshC [Aestuariibaculum suncheonense]